MHPGVIIDRGGMMEYSDTGRTNDMSNQTEWTEKAADNSRSCWKGFISSRVELALGKVSRDAKYMELCECQKADEEMVDSIFGKLDQEERITVRRYYEDDTAKKGYELDEAYRQGVKDGIQFFLCLDVMQVKEWMGE